MKLFDINDWYWIVGEDQTSVFSSAVSDYVSSDDERYVEWLAGGNWPSPAEDEDALIEFLAPRAPYIVPNFPKGLLAYAARCRYDIEIGGIQIAGVPVATDDRSKLMITGARLAATADPSFTTQWLGTDGNVYDLNAPEILGISDAVSLHVANCFRIYAEVATAIGSGAIKTPAQIDAAFAA